MIEGEYGKKGGAMSQDIMPSSSNLAHTYNRAFLYKQRREDNVFCQHFKPHANSGQQSINVLPNLTAPGSSRSSGLSSMAYAGPMSTPINSRLSLSQPRWRRM